MSWNRFLSISNTLLGRINIFSHCRCLLGIFFLAATSLVYAGVPADENYDDNPGYAANSQNSFSLDGVKYTITGNTTYSTITSNNSGFSPLGGGSDYFLLFDSNGNFNVSSVKIEATDGSYFRLSGISIDAVADNNITITPYNGATAGTPVSYTSNGLYVTQQNINLSSNTNFQYITSIVIAGGNLALAIDDLNFEAAVPPVPTITSATYNASTGVLVATGTNFTATGGATNDVIASKFTLTAEGGSTYTLTDTANVEITGATSFSLTLSATDSAAVNQIVNKNGTSSTSGTTYNLAGAAGFIADAASTADLTGNGITVSNVAIPTITSATYDASTGTFAVTGTNLLRKSGSSNDIDGTKFSFKGEGGSGATYTFVDTSSVDLTSGTNFTLVLGTADRNAVNLIADKNGNSSVSGTSYVLNGLEDWAAGADSAVTTADSVGNGVTVSNVAVPTITSATYNVSTGVLVVTGTGFLRRSGNVNDIVANKFTFTGQGASTYTLTDTANVEVTSTTSFTLTLSSTDSAGASLLLNNNGTSSTGGTTYNLAAAEDWAAGVDAAVVVADLTGNGITVSNALSAPSAPTIGTATAGDGQVSVTFTAPGSNGGSAITTYTATASPGGAFGTCAGPTACTITVTGLTNGTAYAFTVTATNSIGTGSASTATSSVTPKGTQTITFANPGAQNFGTTPTLTATATSSLTTTFTSSTTGVCTITSGGALTFVTAGTCTVNADQAGNTSWNAAGQVSRSFTVNAVVPAAPTIGTATAGNTQATVTFSAPASSGGASITGYTVTANPGGATGTGVSSPITVTGLTNGVAYTFTVTATNSAGTGSASAASNSATPKAVQTITFANPGAQNFGTTPTLTATSDSGLTPTFTSSTSGICIVTSGGALTFVSTGTCTINVDQAGNGSYLSASQVSRSFTVNSIIPGAPTAAVATAGDTQASIAFTAPASTGGATITGYTVTSNPGGITGTGASSPIIVTGLTNGIAYTFTVTATNSAGTGSASAASNSITPSAAQTITFANPGTQNFGTTPTFAATADSGLTPTFTSSTTAVCTITSGGALTFVTAGTCTINADQAGNGSYLAASQVSRSFTVNGVLPGAPVIGSASAGSSNATVNFNAPVATGGVAITSYTVTASPGGATASGPGSPITVSGLSNGTAYTFTVRATNLVGTGSPSAASNSVTPRASQIITFANPGAQTLGTAPTLTATSDSGLTPTFTSLTTAVCTITTGGALTFVAVGTCTVTADQVGNNSYLAATQISHSFTVNGGLPGAPVIGLASASNGSATVNFSAPVSSGGIAITGYTLTASPGGATATGAGSPITISGLSNGTAYTFIVRAVNSTGTGLPSAASNSVTPKASQTINFTNPGDQIVGETVSLNATASSGLTPSFSSSTPLICTVTGKQVKLLIVGTCTILVEASSSSSYESASDSQSFTVKPEPNKVPVITQGSGVSVTVNEDSKIAFSLSATDANNEALSWTIKTQPLHGIADVGITGGTSYTPSPDYNGTDSFVVAVTDGKDTAAATVSVTVTPVNDAPTISGAPALNANSDEAYSFVAVGSDVDKDDTLTYSITNKPAWASFNSATGALTGTPVSADIGTITRNIVISVSDGTESASLPAFNIKVSSANPALPVLTVPGDIIINATALYTPVTLRKLLALPATSSQADVDKALMALAVDSNGDSCCTTLPEGLVGDQVLLLKPGVNVVKWTAKNTAGLSNSGVQLVNVNPLISLSKSQIAVRGTDTDFKVILNGVAPVYPLTISYVLDPATTATAAEYSLASGNVVLTEGQLEATIPVQIKPASGLSDSQIIVRLAEGNNAGPANSHTISLREGNVPPIVSLTLTQGGFPTTLVTPTGGAVTVTAHVVDPNVKDTHSFDWSATTGLADTDSNPVDATRVFSPIGLTGSQQVQVVVTDSGGAVVQAQLYFRVQDQLPVLSSTVDTDKDGLADQLEGTGDSDSNGIPDYLDNMPASNILPQQIATTTAYLVECDPGVRCGLGLLAMSGKSGGVQILNDEIGTLPNFKADPGFTPVGGIFDFVIRDLPTAGQSTRVVIPQTVAVPANAVYRKYQKGQWVNFVVDQNNAVHSALGNAGHCPPPGADDWKTGLVAGSLCVQLTIQDGGPNDDDGKVNSAVADPGVVSTAVVVPPVVVPPVEPPVEPPSTGGGKKKGGAVDLLMCLFLLGGLLTTRFKKR